MKEPWSTPDPTDDEITAQFKEAARLLWEDYKRPPRPTMYPARFAFTCRVCHAERTGGGWSADSRDYATPIPMQETCFKCDHPEAGCA